MVHDSYWLKLFVILVYLLFCDRSVSYVFLILNQYSFEGIQLETSYDIVLFSSDTQYLLHNFWY